MADIDILSDEYWLKVVERDGRALLWDQRRIIYIIHFSVQKGGMPHLSDELLYLL